MNWHRFFRRHHWHFPGEENGQWRAVEIHADGFKTYEWQQEAVDLKTGERQWFAVRRYSWGIDRAYKITATGDSRYRVIRRDKPQWMPV